MFCFWKTITPASLYQYIKSEIYSCLFPRFEFQHSQSFVRLHSITPPFSFQLDCGFPSFLLAILINCSALYFRCLWKKRISRNDFIHEHISWFLFRYVIDKNNYISLSYPQFEKKVCILPYSWSIRPSVILSSSSSNQLIFWSVIDCVLCCLSSKRQKIFVNFLIKKKPGSQNSVPFTQ